MTYLQAHTMNELYPRVLKELESAPIAKPRGYTCHELRPAHLVLENPRLGLYGGADRRLNYRFWAVELASYLAGWGGPGLVALLTKVNKNMARFVDPHTNLLEGAYGPAIMQGFVPCIEALRADPDTRQAVLPIWHWRTNRHTTDVPCTVALHFWRAPSYDDFNAFGAPPKRLCCTTYMRSNDVDWGLPYDIASFCAIQLAVVGCLGEGWVPGEYHHIDGSLHSYVDHVPELRDDTPQDTPLARIPTPTYAAGDNGTIIHEHASQLCGAVLAHEGPWANFEWPTCPNDYWYELLCCVRFGRAG